MTIHSPVHSSIGTPSGGGLRHAALGLLARQRFQDLFHSPHRGAFHRSLAVLVRYRSLQVLSLGEWSPQLPAAFHGRRRTRESSTPAPTSFAYGALTPSGRAFQSRSARMWLVRRPPCGTVLLVAQPPIHVGHSPRHGCGLGSSAFARHYLRSVYPFLRVLRCFSSPGSLHRVYRFNAGCRPITADGLPHSGTPGSQPALRLPRAFRSAPRPSSACNAKASTSDACSLTAQSPCLFFHTTLNPVARPPRPTGGAGPRKVPDIHHAEAREDAGPCGLGAVRFLECSYLSCQRASGSPWTRTRGLCLIRAAL